MALWRFLPSWWRCRRSDDEDESELAILSHSTRRFVTLLKVPYCKQQQQNQKQGLVFLLASESLSERSSADAIELVQKVQPSAVIAQIDHGSIGAIRSEEQGSSSMTVPSSCLGVLMDSFTDVTKRSSYDSSASLEVLKTIFGTTCYGHVLSAKEAAIASNASFLYLETPGSKASEGFGESTGAPPPPQAAIAGGLALSMTSSSETSVECPPFATLVYSLLVYLQQYMPGMEQELQQARRLLFKVEQGSEIDPEQLAAAQKFRLAKESLRVDLNTIARQVHHSSKSRSIQKLEELPLEDQGYVIMVQAIQEQARKHGSVVVVMNASCVGGIRKHWNTRVPAEALSRDCFLYSEEPIVEDMSLEKALAGPGAVAAVGIVSLPWWAPATSFTKVLVLKAPAFAKLTLLQLKRNAGTLIAKTIFPAGNFSFSTLLKTATSAGKARTAAHGLVATAERATLSGVRTAFYCLMRKQQGMSHGGRPWLLLGSSIAAGAGIIWWRDRLESAIESVPQAPKLARLGRGLNNLQTAAAALRESHSRELYRDIS